MLHTWQRPKPRALPMLVPPRVQGVRGAIRSPVVTRDPYLALQAVRILSRLPRPAIHPLRALRTGAARPTLPGREWAAVSCYADPVTAVGAAAWAMDSAIWQWAPVPANFARAVLESGALRHIRRVVELGAAHADRCVAASSRRLPRAAWVTVPVLGSLLLELGATLLCRAGR